MPSTSGCLTLIQMCGDKPKSSANIQCQRANFPFIPSSAQSTQNINGMCNSTSSNLDECKNCKDINSTSKYADCDILKTYSTICQKRIVLAPTSNPPSQCREWAIMCHTNANLTAFCGDGKYSYPKATGQYPTNNLASLNGIPSYLCILTVLSLSFLF
jgi:hypothetical protein